SWLLPVSVIHISAELPESIDRFRGLARVPLEGTMYVIWLLGSILSMRLPPESAMNMFPDGSISPPAGYIGPMPAALYITDWKEGLTLATVKTWMRLLLASATYRCCAESNAIPCGALN